MIRRKKLKGNFVYFEAATDLTQQSMVPSFKDSPRIVYQYNIKSILLKSNVNAYRAKNESWTISSWHKRFLATFPIIKVAQNVSSKNLAIEKILQIEMLLSFSDKEDYLQENIIIFNGTDRVQKQIQMVKLNLWSCKRISPSGQKAQYEVTLQTFLVSHKISGQNIPTDSWDSRCVNKSYVYMLENSLN